MENAFEQTQEQMKKMAIPQARNPQIDANGNVIANEPLDMRTPDQRRIPADISSLSLPPAFASQPPTQAIVREGSRLLRWNELAVTWVRYL